jgi:hypothetical protein
MKRNICLLVHGEEGTGKSWLGQTTPGPRLVLDAEGGSRAPWKPDGNGSGVRVKTCEWEISREDPPYASGSWETCWAAIRNFDDMNTAYEWLVSGDHDFRSIVIDSVTEIQKRCKDDIGGTDKLRIQDWDLMLIRMDALIRQYRDLVFHKTNPLDAVVFLAMTQEKAEKWKPAVQGALSISLPGYVDVEGYLYVAQTEEEKPERRLLIQPHERFAAKDRTHVLTLEYGQVIPNPDVTEMLAVINEE